MPTFQGENTSRSLKSIFSSFKAFLEYFFNAPAWYIDTSVSCIPKYQYCPRTTFWLTAPSNWYIYYHVIYILLLLSLYRSCQWKDWIFLISKSNGINWILVAIFILSNCYHRFMSLAPYKISSFLSLSPKLINFHFLQVSERSLRRIRVSRPKISPASWVWTRPKMPNV